MSPPFLLLQQFDDVPEVLQHGFRLRQRYGGQVEFGDGFAFPAAGRRQLTNGRRSVTLGALQNPTKVSAVQIKKAIRTAAGEARIFPLQMVLDGDEVLSGLVDLLSHRQAR